MEIETNNSEEMSRQEKNAETSRLINSSNASATPSYLNIVSNICALIFVGIITYSCFSNEPILFSFHPTLMSLGWVMFMTSAINAVTPGDLATEWMPIRLRSARHWVIQVLTATFVFIGFIIILVNKIRLGKDHFTTTHAKFGLAAIVFMFTTMLGGLGALYSLKLKDYIAPIYIKLIHASAGLITFALGVIAILIVLLSQWWKFGEILRYTSMTLVLLVMMFTILRPSLKIYFRIKERINNGGVMSQ